MKVLEFIKNNKDWRELLIKEPYRLRIKDYSPNEYITFYKLSYHISPNFNINIVRECRGVIIKEDKRNGEYSIASRVFPKFFNYNEQIPEDEEQFNDDGMLTDYTFVKKLDGSMIHYWYDESMGWTFSSRGCILAKEAMMDNGQNLQDIIDAFLEKNEDFKNAINLLNKKDTYIFELTSPYNKVVVEYEEIQLNLIAIYTNKTGAETVTINGLANDTYPNMKTMYFRNDITDALDGWNNEEGFILMKIDGEKIHRFKMKNKEYVKRANLKNKFNDIRFKKFDIKWLEIYMKGEYDEFVSYFPEFKINIDTSIHVYEKFKIFLRDLYNKAIEGIDINNRKDIMIKLNTTNRNYTALLKAIYLNKDTNDELDEIFRSYDKALYNRS